MAWMQLQIGYGHRRHFATRHRKQALVLSTSLRQQSELNRVDEATRSPKEKLCRIAHNKVAIMVPASAAIRVASIAAAILAAATGVTATTSKDTTILESKDRETASARQVRQISGQVLADSARATI
jgi:hypothetical protein